MTWIATSSIRTSIWPRSGDEAAVRSLSRVQFDSLDWAPGRDGDWSGSGRDSSPPLNSSQ